MQQLNVPLMVGYLSKQAKFDFNPLQTIANKWEGVSAQDGEDYATEESFSKHPMVHDMDTRKASREAPAAGLSGAQAAGVGLGTLIAAAGMMLALKRARARNSGVPA